MNKVAKKRFLPVVAALLVALCALPLLTACSGGGESTVTGGSGQDKLYIYNWEDYIDTALIDEFSAYYEEVTGRSIDVTYTTFDTNETMLTKVQKGDANVDLICPSEYAIEKLMRGGYVRNLTELVADLGDEYGMTFDNLDNIEPDVRTAISAVFGDIPTGNGTNGNMLDYMVPYMWGTLGILYNKSVVSQEELDEHGWGVLWNAGNNPELEGEILLKDSIRDTYCAAVLYLRDCGMLPEGNSPSLGKPYTEMTTAELINSTDDALLDAVEKVLIEQRDHISGYEVDFGKDDMINEIVYVDLAWSGDALWAIEESYDEETEDYTLGYYVPESGSNIWYDGWIVPTTVRNELAAVMFIDYMCRPDSAARNTSYICYTSAVARDKVRSDPDAIAALLDVEYLWYASSEECELYTDPKGNLVFYYDWGDGEPYYLDADGTDFKGNADTLTAFEATTDEEGYWLDGNGEYIVDAGSMKLFFEDTARYAEITDALGVMRDYGAANDRVVQMWERVKAGAETPWALIWCLIAVVLIVGGGIGLYFAREAFKRRPRRVVSAAAPAKDADGSDKKAD